jgi:D-alanyl-D-alanine carboxypeptidase/D-alanyl-D-alanine-endopeptidase (penicillin-binding protein 4)
VVQEVGSARPTVAHEAQDTMNPASVMKLVTTYAALELLGPAYRWKTEAYVDGNDVVLKGYGDPKLNYESFWMLLRALHGRGLRDIRGDLVLDRSWFGAVADGRIDDDSFRPYNVAPDALLVNFKSLHFTFLPAESAVRVFAEPALPGLEIVNSLKLAEGGCPEGRAFRSLLQAEFQSKPPRASFTGAYPVACGEKELNVALYEPQEYVAAMVKQLWAEMGGTWAGVVRQGSASPAARLLYVHESEPLAEIVRDINKFSNNVMARQLYLTLAAEMGGAPARPELALVAIKQLLTARGIKAGERRHHCGGARRRLAQPGDAGVRLVPAGGRRRWHDEEAPARRRGCRPRAHQVGPAAGRAFHRRLRARPPRAAASRGDDHQPPACELRGGAGAERNARMGLRRA